MLRCGTGWFRSCGRGRGMATVRKARRVLMRSTWVGPLVIALFLILFVWQFPHFDAIAWMYREDYARGGIRMLPVIDFDGESTARRVVFCSLLLIPFSLLPRFLGMTGQVYAAVATALAV